MNNLHSDIIRLIASYLGVKDVITFWLLNKHTNKCLSTHVYITTLKGISALPVRDRLAACINLYGKFDPKFKANPILNIYPMFDTLPEFDYIADVELIKIYNEHNFHIITEMLAALLCRKLNSGSGHTQSRVDLFPEKRRKIDPDNVPDNPINNDNNNTDNISNIDDTDIELLHAFELGFKTILMTNIKEFPQRRGKFNLESIRRSDCVTKPKRVLFDYLLIAFFRLRDKTRRLKLDPMVVLPASMTAGESSNFYFDILRKLSRDVTWVDGLPSPGLNFYLLATENTVNSYAAVKFVKARWDLNRDNIGPNLQAVRNAMEKCDQATVDLLHNIFPDAQAMLILSQFQLNI